MIGKTISHYRILEKIGEGGMGVVYKAEDTRLKRTVALKFLPQEFTRNLDAKERFIQEAQAAGALDHPNICTVYEINEIEGQIFIVMAYIKGQDLKDRLKSGLMDTENALEIAIQVADGLREAHEKEVIHRDIKPANIILTEKGQAKIMDFGLAKLSWGVDFTKTATIMGTVAYMSPEQAKGEDVDHRTDIWSLGAMLYEMLVGERPFNGYHDSAAIHSILNEELEPVSRLRKGIPTDLDHIVQKALEKDSTDRYEDMRAMISDLKAIASRGKPSFSSTRVQQVKTKPSIAVLPFVDMSPQRDQEYFCEGMAEELINGFSKIANLQVASRTSSFQFMGKGYDIFEVGKKLKVQTVLEGSIRKAGDRLRITAQLINVADGFHVWSEKYDRDMDDIFAIQDEISLAIVDKLKVKLLGEEKAALVKHHTENKEAYNAYLRGLYFWNRRNEVGFDKALASFRQAIEIDPLYALPYVGIADTFNIAGHFCFLPPKDAFSKARAAASKALEIDETIGEAHTSMAWVHTYFDWDWDLAEEEYRRALELNPNYATGHEWYAIFLMGLGRLDEAIAEAQKALELDPISSMINAIVGVVFHFSRQYDKAFEQYQKTIEIDPNFPWAYIWKGIAYMENQMYDQALEYLQKAESISKDLTYGLGFLGMCYGLLGQKEEAKKVLERLDAISKKKYVAWSFKAFVYVGLGEVEKAFDCWDKACEKREPELFYAKTTPWYNDWFSGPRYDALLKKIGF
jgi:serine/threonine protein kinase/Tfp pilus assembly protein PilF